MRYFFHPQAEEELIAAGVYYEGCESGLGASFARGVGAFTRTPPKIPQDPPGTFCDKKRVDPIRGMVQKIISCINIRGEICR